MSKLAEFLINLTQDPALIAKYKSDPEATMRQAGLSDAEIAMVNNQDISAIQGVVGDDVSLTPNGLVKAYRK